MRTLKSKLCFFSPRFYSEEVDAETTKLCNTENEQLVGNLMAREVIKRFVVLKPQYQLALAFRAPVWLTI